MFCFKEKRMDVVWNLITPVNVAFCSAIFVLGLLSYIKRKNRTALCVGIAFALFGVSHILAIIYGGGYSEAALVISRVVAYLLIIIALIIK